MADNWKPSEALYGWALQELALTAPKVDRILAEFKDYWKAVAGAAGRKLDWEATFRNRLRTVTEAKKAAGRDYSDEGDRYLRDLIRGKKP